MATAPRIQFQEDDTHRTVQMQDWEVPQAQSSHSPPEEWPRYMTRSLPPLPLLQRNSISSSAYEYLDEDKSYQATTPALFHTTAHNRDSGNHTNLPSPLDDSASVMSRPAKTGTNLPRSRGRPENTTSQTQYPAHPSLKMGSQIDESISPLMTPVFEKQSHQPLAVSPLTPDESLFSDDETTSEPGCSAHADQSDTVNTKARKLKHRYSDPGSPTNLLAALSHGQTVVQRTGKHGSIDDRGPPSPYHTWNRGFGHQKEQKEPGRVQFAVNVPTSFSERLRADKKIMPGRLQLRLGKSTEEAQKTPYPQQKSGWTSDDDDEEDTSE